jgi:hypothetical protein
VKTIFATITQIFYFERYIFAPLQQPMGLEIQIEHVSAPGQGGWKVSSSRGIVSTRQTKSVKATSTRIDRAIFPLGFCAWENAQNYSPDGPYKKETKNLPGTNS